MATPPGDRPTYTTEAIPSDVNNGVFLGNPVIDNLVSCMIAMSAEMWATKRRMKVLEAVLAQSGISPDKIEKFVPSEAQSAQWTAERDRYVELVMGPLANQGYKHFSSDFEKR